MIIGTIRAFDILKSTGRDIYIRGAGQQGKRLYGELSRLGISPKGFIDAADPDNSLSAYTPDEIYARPKGSYIIVNSVYNNDAYFHIRQEMEAAGLKEWEDFLDFGRESDYRKTLPMQDVIECYPNRDGMRRAVVKSYDGAWAKYFKALPADRDFSGDTILFPNIDLRITTACNLKCANCSHCFPYAKAEHFDLKQIVDDLDKLLGISHICYLNLIGGEIFMHPHYEEIFERLCGLKNLDGLDCIYITTNASTIPTDRALLSFKKLKNHQVHISNYGKLSRHMDGLIAKLSDFDIPYIVMEDESTWIDPGSFEEREYTKDELRRLYAICDSAAVCSELHNGKLYACCRIATMNEYGLMPFDGTAFVDIRNGGANLRADVKKYMDRDYFEGCRYCDGIYNDGRMIPKAIQLKSK